MQSPYSRQGPNTLILSECQTPCQLYVGTVGPVNCVASPREGATNLRLHDGDQTGGLAGGGVPSEDVGVLHDGLVAGRVLSYGQHRPPLGKLTAVSLVLLAPLVQVIKALGGSLPLATKQRLHALVNLRGRRAGCELSSKYVNVNQTLIPGIIPLSRIRSMKGVPSSAFW